MESGKDKYSILLVDDDPIILESARIKLSQRGFLVTPANSGEEAFTLLQNNDFDIVITDLIMYDIGGIEVLKHAKEKRPQTIVIILTGNQDYSLTLDALRNHADDFLLKGSSIKEVVFRLEKCIDRLELTRSYHHVESVVQKRTEELSKINAELNRQIKEKLKIEKELRRTQLLQENIIEDRTKSLQETNTALTVLLEKQRDGIQGIEERIAEDIMRQIMPVIIKLKQIASTKEQMMYLELLNMEVNTVVSSHTSRMSAVAANLTPTEMRIASLIRKGRTTKEISGILGNSIRTIESHRARIRKKIGLIDRNTNLESFLTKLE
ncbi:MAG: response regulator transcription factor [Spirochaetales bacterium]|nr:response regulator transcription factor [Spirochaetales bacterium]